MTGRARSARAGPMPEMMSKLLTGAAPGCRGERCHGRVEIARVPARMLGSFPSRLYAIRAHRAMSTADPGRKQ
jgi:hypothetical protein